MTVTVTATSPRSQVSLSPMPAKPGNYAVLVSGFPTIAASSGVNVGIAMAPVGGDAVPELTLGDRTARVAWSTIKVPLAVAAERAHGPSSAEAAAIVNSDNASAEQLWSSLGSPVQAADAVTQVLREGGDSQTTVPSQALRPGFTTFGQTVWSLSSAATFMAHLSCLPGTDHVIDLMGRVAGNQQWGVESMPTPASTAVKGGWGPGIADGYLVRQIALVRYRDGRSTAVAMSAVADSMVEGINALNDVARWLNAHIARLPRGRC
ncbi:serine hydrolase [Gordonia sp. DT218]|uniref:serine hydrolase n=1 Tax=unclassified Gordonia (in: high G+C Gram-positive bacteria) TaxID=2657482 RepID=UPI003CED2F36